MQRADRKRAQAEKQQKKLERRTERAAERKTHEAQPGANESSGEGRDPET